MDDQSTIFAPASGFGRAAVAVIRLSGPACAAVLTTLSGTLPPPRRLALRTLRDPGDGAVLDKALVCWMPGPGTFSGEDMAELHLHGGAAVRAGVIRVLAGLPGCRPAEAGAFTRRAVLNGRMDLTEAEGVADLIEAETAAQARQALRQLDGALGRQVEAWREEILTCLAGAEAALDFSDEGDVDDAALDRALIRRAAAVRDAVAAALADGRRGERLREGYTVVLAGAPNAGKSTLLNALSRRDAAIVSDRPGTTRDVIEVRLDLGGLPVLLVDTAGLRETEDALEAEGIARTRRRIAQADLVVLLDAGDGAKTLTEAAEILRVRTKADLGVAADAAGTLAISALTGSGMDALLEAIRARAEAAIGGEGIVTRERHREALTRCAAHLDRVVGAGAAAPPELVAEDLRLAARALGEVSGRVSVEAVLDRLFSSFCIGK
ncbi:tRNA uridine-5-carboxymethylaminomethyl(34) synthesis GTPase MnmE [Methylobacterium radiodurans]|uniref:tRNA modification GTPase MnmE n=1 Tax=Methylobacterium radiodurans TaxID=2202828 RepID=A0A2U8VMY9_9HYPH|nr:tRNA uridine-5-carboxymethylaminomethyl(34) synthesis GTPase MnmE [Methylobacterium radiodurans]AWN34983.1 tRNA uridine-5-carboxymethylaminomethyl(34) synthesis GTPase MnmE [Methylobacterium radiodurans]